MHYESGPLDGQEVFEELEDRETLEHPVRVDTKRGFITKVALYVKSEKKECFRFQGWKNDE